MKFSITISFLVLYSLFGNCQTFFKSIDIDNQFDEGVAIRKLSSGYLIYASSLAYGNSVGSISIINTDFDGNINWVKQYKNNEKSINPPDSYGNHGMALAYSEGNQYYTGTTKLLNNNSDCFILKTDENGDSIWLKKYGTPYNDFTSDIFFRNDTTLLIYSDISVSVALKRIWLFEVNLDGNLVWEKQYSMPNGPISRQDILQLNSGDIVFTYTACVGATLCGTTDEKILKITKIDLNGKELWTKDAYHFSEHWSNSSMVQLPDGDFVLSFHRTNLESGWFYPPILIWLDSLGNFKFEHDFSEQSESLIKDLIVTKTGLIVGVGYFDKLEFGYAGWIFALDQTGNLIWNKEINDLRYPDKVSVFNAIEESETGGFIITGYIQDTLTNVFPPRTDKNILLVKVDSLGCLSPGCDEFQIVSVKDDVEATGQGIKFYPNPANDILYLDDDEKYELNEIYTVNVFNTLGRKVKQETNFSIGEPIKIGNLCSGMYFIQIMDDKQKIIGSKIIMKR
jgi:hypothetical protein